MMDAEEACKIVDDPQCHPYMGRAQWYEIAETLRQALAEAQHNLCATILDRDVHVDVAASLQRENFKLIADLDALRRKLDAAMKVVEAGRNYRSAVKASYRTNCGKDGFSEAMAAKRETGRALDDALAALESDLT